MRISWYGRSIRRLALTALGVAWGTSVFAQLPSFNGAEGYGGTFTGSAPAGGWFSNAEVYHVTTTQDLLDAGKGAFGTLRGAFVDFTQANSHKQKASDRIVVFDVGGTFELTQGKLDMKEINNIYIAGQTAPSPVTVYGNMSQITKSDDTFTSNVVLRYMTFRKGTGPEDDAVSFIGGDGVGDTVATNMILDHVTASWSEDENISVANNNTNITVQYSLIHDALVDDHAYGSLIRPKVSSNVTFHHNLYANNASRQARFGTYFNETLTADFRNNVVYNFRDRASYAGGSSQDANTTQEFANVNYVGNYIVAGPGTGTKPSDFGGADYAFRVDKNITAQVYQSGNYIDPDEAVGGTPSDGVLDGSDTGTAMFVVTTPVTDQSLTFMGSPFAAPAVTTQSAPAAYDQVVRYAGNSWWARDVIDTRVINNVLDFTGPSLAASAPISSELTYVTSGAYPNAPTTRPANWDSDGDGMPDHWELSHGLNPNLGTDFKLDFDGDGYVNGQEYLDEIGAFPAPAPIVFNGATSSRYAQITNWKTDDGGITAGSNWQPSKYDEAQINSGTAVVDAIGQHAGVLKLGATAGSNGHLDVNSGWLDVDDTIFVGAHAMGQGVLTLGGGDVIAQDVVVGFFGQLRGAGTLTGNVTSNGVVLPGNSPGTLSINGNYTQLAEGVLSIDLAAAASYDKLVVNGDVALGGLLEVMLLDEYEPVAGTSFDVLDWTGSHDGMFDMLALPELSASLGWDTSLLNSQGVLSVVAVSASLAGDYNDDGTVDAADYTVWRDGLGSNTPLFNETASLGVVDQEDYDAWKANLGAMAAGSGSSTAGTVPEPGCLAIVVVSCAILAAWRRGR